MRRLSLSILAFAVALLVGKAAADDLADFNAAVEDAAVHNRKALRHLGAGNAGLAVLELERFREAWGALVGKFGPIRPVAFRENQLYVTTFVDVQTRIIGAELVINMGRPDLARTSLTAIRKELSEMRRASGVEVLADCILDANGTMDGLFAKRDHPLDWTKPQTASDLAAMADAYGTIVKRCDEVASPEVRSHPLFLPSVNGIKMSLTRMQSAITDRDEELIRHLLIELRSFDDLLAFHYG